MNRKELIVTVCVWITSWFYKKIFICFKLSINVQNYKINCGQRSTPRHRPTRLCPYANEVNRPNLHTEPPIGCSQFTWLLGEHVGTPWNGVRMRDPVEICCAPLVRGIVWEIDVIFGDDLDTYGYTWDSNSHSIINGDRIRGLSFLWYWCRVSRRKIHLQT